VFFIAAGIYLIDVIFYGLFAKGVEQPWNRIKESEMDLKQRKNNLESNNHQA